MKVSILKNLFILYKDIGINHIFEDISLLQDIKEQSISHNESVKSSSNKNISLNITKQNIIKIPNGLDKINDIDSLKIFLENYNECSLKNTAMNTVLGDGNIDSDILVIGEAPGADEDEQGLPFVGRSGKLLMSAFESVGLSRDKIYITNSVFWRPPGNRNPTKEELNLCYPFVRKVVEIVKPKIILSVGSISAKNILKIESPISKIKKNWYNSFENVPCNIKVLYHPAYLLRNPSKKKDLWLDLLDIKDKIQQLDIKL